MIVEFQNKEVNLFSLGMPELSELIEGIVQKYGGAKVKEKNNLNSLYSTAAGAYNRRADFKVYKPKLK